MEEIKRIIMEITTEEIKRIVNALKINLNTWTNGCFPRKHK